MPATGALEPRFDRQTWEVGLAAPKHKINWRKLLGIPLFGAAGAVTAVVVLFVWMIGPPCLPLGLQHGLWIQGCPAKLRLEAQVDAHYMRRGATGTLEVCPQALYLQGKGVDANRRRKSFSRGFGLTVDLVAPDDTRSRLKVNADDTHRCAVYAIDLPLDLPDGEYTLLTNIDAGFDAITVESPLSLFTPALVHVMTDRPLYRPGQDVQFRAAMLNRTDMAPIEDRGGRWILTNPEGTAVLEERGLAGAWGIAASSFPIDRQAVTGTWTLIWRSGDDSASTEFDVRPFRLPRAKVELTASQTWYRAGDALIVDGLAKLNSGAPIANGRVSATLHIAQGRWPAPVEWDTPFRTTTDRNGGFTLNFGDVPADILEQADASVSVRVTTADGETTDARTVLKLSETPITITAVTDFGDGLVGGLNNRAYLRVTHPDGSALANTEIKVSNPWDPTDTGQVATTDVDGVAALQLDPGDPITVVHRAPPARPRPFSPAMATLATGRVMPNGGGLSLEQRRAIDRVAPSVTRCGDYALQTQNVQLGLQTDAAGRITTIVGPQTPLGQCVQSAMRTMTLPTDGVTSFEFTWSVSDSLRPTFHSYINMVPTPPADTNRDVSSVIGDAALRARPCLDRGEGLNRELVAEVHFQLTEGETTLRPTLAWKSLSLTESTRRCVGASLASASLRFPSEINAVGAVQFRLDVPRPPGAQVQSDRTETAYELQIIANDQKGRLILPVGVIPSLRMRVSPSLASPGDDLAIKLIRGPDWYGEVPDEVVLLSAMAEDVKADIDTDAKTATIRVPDNVHGFIRLQTYAASAMIFIQRPDPLRVTLSTDQSAYRPGETAQLTVATSAGDLPVAAGVTLSGVDETLGQLARLPGPTEWGEITVRAEASAPAFDAFSPIALALGQVRGEHAAMAAVLRVNSMPQESKVLYAAASGHSSIDETEVLTVHFYRTLSEVIDRVHAWEESGAPEERLSPERMASFWRDAVRDMSRNGKRPIDAYDRTLTLDVLPNDLLVQVDPRTVVADGTRLPEDVTDWVRWVRTEVN